jgi:uncharacterized protein
MYDPLIDRTRPADDPLSDFFWASGADGHLRFLRCDKCGYFSHPPTARCPRCLADSMTPTPVAGTGTIYTFTVNYQPWVVGQRPYVIAVIGLDEQPDLRITSNVVGCGVDDVAIGDRVKVTFLHRHERWYPLFERLERSSG